MKQHLDLYCASKSGKLRLSPIHEKIMNLVIVTLVLVAFTLAALVLLSKRDQATNKAARILAPIEHKQNGRKHD
jgi:hypothetical protein